MKKSILVKPETNIYVAGIYALTTRGGKVLYVGSALECNDALSRHNYNVKRNKYIDTNKRKVQCAFDRDDLIFTILHVSAYSDDVRNMSIQQKEDLQEALSVLEKMYIDLYKDTICNCQLSVTKHSSNKNSFSTYKRRIANSGERNPRVVYDEILVSNILYLKQLGLKPKKIIELLLEHDIKVTNAYISRLGVDRWVHLDPQKPSWIDEKEVC